jgi:quercetin dioxygenase-like cupin family protein
MKITVKNASNVPASPVEMDGADRVSIRLLVHEEDRAPNFYMRQFDVEPGGHTPRHTHAWEHECYILSGQGALVGEEGESPVGPGDCFLVPSQAVHQFRCTGNEPLRFLCLVPKETR